MKVCVAQTRPAKGDIQRNIVAHKKLISLAVSKGADMIIFPELSLTGYEPTLAKELAIDLNDGRLDDFQKISDESGIAIGVGAPVKIGIGICISMLIFPPHKPRAIYSKQYLHSDEEEYFVSGENLSGLNVNSTNIALAICYELSVPIHAETAFKNGAELYVASVAKTAGGVDKALKSLAEIARKFSIPVIMSNCTGECDGEECAGRSSAWDTTGQLIGQLRHTGEGIMIFETETQEVRIIEEKKAE